MKYPVIGKYFNYIQHCVQNIFSEKNVYIPQSVHRAYYLVINKSMACLDIPTEYNTITLLSLKYITDF